MEPVVTLLDLAQNSTPHYAAHQNIFVSLRAQPCSNVHSVLEDERCLFVRETEECRESMHYLDYMHFVYCIVDSSNVLLFTSAIVALLLFVLLLGTLIYHLCVTRYVDSVLYVAKSWRLNEYIAGVTLLTYGNGLAQVLSELKHHTSGDTELIYNQYLGTAVYQVSFLAALVIWMGSFAIYPEVIVPNLISLMIVSLLVEEFMYDEQVNFALPLHGWNKCLFIVNLILFPLFLIGTALVDMISSENLGWICLGSLIGSACFSVIVCSTSCYDRKPPFFTCIGLFAIFGTSYVIMLLSYELIAILEALSIIASVSSASFAITILAWGSCWIDLITLRTLAVRGYSRIGFAACLGAPVFNILIGLCTVFCVQMIRSGTTQIHVRDGTSGPTCAIYLFVTSMTILLSVLFTRFEARESIAFCLTTLYVTFLAYVAFCEFEVTHGYGTDHNDDGEYFLDRVPGRREH
uniref:Sodium/calcium exchanger membrane region domain-containing protein n=1 Tax=Anopheles melas TaxID=34690 RepID=A0A182TCT5_9DIPT